MGITKDYPANLLEEIGMNELLEVNVDYNHLTEDQMKGLNWLLQEYLNKRERIIIMEKYQYLFTDKEMREKWDLEEKRFQMIIERGFRKLRKPGPLAYVVEGYDAHTSLWESLLETQKTVYRRCVLDPNYLEELYEGPLENLGLDSRTLGALKKHRIDDVSTLLCVVQWKKWWSWFCGIGPETVRRSMVALYDSGLLPLGFHQMDLIKDIPKLEWRVISMVNLVNSVGE